MGSLTWLSGIGSFGVRGIWRLLIVPTRVEDWGRKGKISVSRDLMGRFVRWVRYVEPVHYQLSGKAVAMYGTARTRDGTMSRRYEFYGGSGRDIYHAIAWAVNHPPKDRFVSVRTGDFLANPWNYSTGGYWVDKKVDS
jgi:hypothetical protein